MHTFICYTDVVNYSLLLMVVVMFLFTLIGLLFVIAGDYLWFCKKSWSCYYRLSTAAISTKFTLSFFCYDDDGVDPIIYKIKFKDIFDDFFLTVLCGVLILLNLFCKNVSINYLKQSVNLYVFFFYRKNNLAIIIFFS